MHYALILAQLLNTPWAIDRAQLAALCRVLVRAEHGEPLTPEALAAVKAEAAARRGDGTGRAPGAGNIAVIPVYGAIMQRGGMFGDVCGMTSCQAITAQLRSALADDTVAGIVMDIDSPGGSVYGVQELADEIRAARSVKPVMGISNSLCASAAYWLGSACSELYCTPSGEAGSIGVYAAHEDYSKAMAEAGIDVTLVSAGKFKVEGNPYEPLSAEARAAMQGRIDQYYQAFTAAVAKGRNVPVADVRDGMGQGRVLGAADAKAAGMIDDVDTFDGVIKRMSRAVKRPSPNARALAARDLERLSC